MNAGARVPVVLRFACPEVQVSPKPADVALGFPYECRARSIGFTILRSNVKVTGKRIKDRRSAELKRKPPMALPRLGY